MKQLWFLTLRVNYLNNKSIHVFSKLVTNKWMNKTEWVRLIYPSGGLKVQGAVKLLKLTLHMSYSYISHIVYNTTLTTCLVLLWQD